MTPSSCWNLHRERPDNLCNAHTKSAVMGASSGLVWTNLPGDDGPNSGLHVDFILGHALQGSEEIICANQHDGNSGRLFGHLAIQQAPPEVSNVVTCSQDSASSACQHHPILVCVPLTCDVIYKSLLPKKLHIGVMEVKSSTPDMAMTAVLYWDPRVWKKVARISGATKSMLSITEVLFSWRV